MRTKNGFPEMGSQRERESFIRKEKMKTKNGFPERERESFIRKEKMRTKNGFPEKERELYQKRKSELYRKNENARIIMWSVEEIIKKLKKLII